jgi:hypothetical protein
MCPAISFSAMPILSALLRQDKTQTIRPMKIDDSDWNAGTSIANQAVFGHDKFYKPPRFKVDATVKFYWKMRSKAKMFCRDCGKASKTTVDGKSLYCDTEKCAKTGHFPKLLGTGKMTEVFIIDMVKNDQGYQVLLDKEGTVADESFCDELARRDGFASKDEMFEWFDKHYKLSEKKRFAVYRWLWL